MTPDLKRLCDVAEDAAEQAIKDGYPHEAGTIPSRAIEAAVRAVLMALISENFSQAVAERYQIGLRDPEEIVSTIVMDAALERVISDILAEPATARGGEDE